MQSVYFTAPADWATEHSLGESYLSAEKLSVYSLVPANWVMNVLDITLNCNKSWGSCLEAFGMKSIPSLLMLSGPLSLVVVVPVRVQSIAKTELFNHLLGTIAFFFNF